jgi:thiol-disulfide isomerase/thioredoxin
MLVRLKILAVRYRIDDLDKTLMVLLLGICLSSIYLTATAADQSLPGLGHNLNKLSKPMDAPDFSLNDMDENRHSLDDYRGKVILLNFWATWCPPCRREMPSMERLYQKFKEQAFIVLAINQWEDPDHVFAYTGQLNTDPTFPILFDRESEVSAAYGVKGLPTTYLLDRQGRIRYRALGGREFDHPEVEEIIRQLLQ